MKKNKGFTLVEVLAVISIMGVVIILVMPTLFNVFNQARHMLDKYTKEDIIDAAKMYVTDLDMEVKEYIYNDNNPTTINGTIYRKGDKMSGYDLRVYIIQKNGILVSIKDLVAQGYYDKNCNYNKPKTCKVKESCILKAKIDGELLDNNYYISNGYSAELYSGCE